MLFKLVESALKYISYILHLFEIGTSVSKHGIGVKRLYVRNKPDRYIFKLKKTNKTQINKKKVFLFWYRADSIIRNEIERVDWIHVYTVK